jgi:uncharacterized membrane protein YbaN (DUF454 family)
MHHKTQREMDTGVVEKSEKQKQNLIGSVPSEVTSSRLLKGLLIFAGTLFVGLGILGILLPLLPTTPFLLLAAACYARSSKRFYHWLLSNRWFGKYIKNYQEKRGIPSRVKFSTISVLWITIALSAIFATENLLVRMVLLVVALGVTIHILSLRTLKK